MRLLALESVNVYPANSQTFSRSGILIGNIKAANVAYFSVNNNNFPVIMIIQTKLQKCFLRSNKRLDKTTVFSIHSNDEPWCPLSQRHRKATALQPLQPPFLLISSKFWCRYDPLQRHNIQYEWSAELFISAINALNFSVPSVKISTSFFLVRGILFNEEKSL